MVNLRARLSVGLDPFMGFESQLMSLLSVKYYLSDKPVEHKHQRSLLAGLRCFGSYSIMRIVEVQLTEPLLWTNRYGKKIGR